MQIASESNEYNSEQCRDSYSQGVTWKVKKNPMAKSRKKKKNDGYEIAVGGAKAVIRVLLYVMIILVIVVAGRSAYRFGYMIFDQKPMALTQKSSQDVTVVIKEDDTVYDVGKTLEKRKLIQDAKIFWCQEKLSDYKGKIKPGTYLLNTYQTSSEILRIISGEEKEE